MPLKSEHFPIRIGQSERTRAVRKLPTKCEVIDTGFDLKPSKCYLLRADKNSPEFSLTQKKLKTIKKKHQKCSRGIRLNNPERENNIKISQPGHPWETCVHLHGFGIFICGRYTISEEVKLTRNFFQVKGGLNFRPLQRGQRGVT